MKTFTTLKEILNRRERLGFLLLFFGMLFNSFLEIIGLSMLVPVVQLVAYPEKTVEESWYLRIFINTFHIPSDDYRLMLIIIILSIAVIYIIKAIYFIFFNLWQRRFISGFSRRLSTDLFSNYLYQPYEFHVYHNTSELISHATYDVSNFVSGVNDVMSTLSDVLFCVITFIYLLISEWAMTLVIFAALGIVTVFLNWLFRKKARAYGREAAIINASNLRAVQEGLSGIKETKIAGREQYFISVYDETRKDTQELEVKRAVVGLLPRTFVEALGMLGMLAGLTVYYLLGNPPEKIVGTFSLLALAVVKLLPYISRIAAEINAFRGASWSIQKVGEDMRLVREVPALPNRRQDSPPLHFGKEILLKDITFQYKSAESPVLCNVNAVIPKGKSVAFCGKSGAGKTTTVDLLLGLLKPKSGKVTCDGVDILANLDSWHKNLSYVPQDIYLIDDSIRANIAFGVHRTAISDEQIWKALDQAQLGAFVRGLPKQLDTCIGEKGVRLSGGQRQRIGIARALYRDTPILILDEATSALDYETEGEILRSVESLRGHKTLIIITHRLSTISECDLIYSVQDGQIVCSKGGQNDSSGN